MRFKEKSNRQFKLRRTGDGDSSLEKVEKSNLDEEEEELGQIEDGNRVDFKRRGKELMRRSNLVAKQVISIQSARSLGFVTQLWVDTTSWLVLVVEARPALLSGESERFLLRDISKVGDFVLVEDESVLENGFKMVGLETLVGYRVITPGRRNIGKVRGYTFNVNSGSVESLELDSFGLSIIPSSLVSTYALLVEDVLEVVADAVIVHEAATSRMQRLTKGLWEADNMRTSSDERGDYFDEEEEEEERVRFNSKRSKRRSSRSKLREEDDDLELPMDYL